MQQQSLFDYFGAPMKRRIRISTMIDILTRTRVIEPVPSRLTIIHRCEDGTLDGQLTSFGYLVTEESFKRWVVSLNPDVES